MENSQSSTVLICGAGPTGMTAALELSRLQIPVRIIEKKAEPATTSRAIAVHSRTLELFKQRGLVESMLEKGHKSVATNVHGQGKRVAQINFSLNGSDFPYILFISQSETEAILRNALEKQGVTIERSVEFVALAQSDADRSDHVKAILKHKNGSLEEFNCAYLISTEGAHSVARTTINLNFKGKTRDELYVLGDLHMDTELSTTEVSFFSSEQGLLAIFPMGEGNHVRIVAAYPLSAANKEKMPTLEELQKIYDTKSYVPAQFRDMTWSSWFVINSRMVDRLRVGRVLIGGDSAHIHSPFGGQGMNTGIQDMINLSWKLALVMKGQADPKLLDTYTDDRLPVIQNVLNLTEGLTDFLGNQSLLYRSAFNLIAPWVAGREFVQRTVTQRMNQLLLNYRESTISISHNAAGTLRGGDRMPNLKVQNVGGESEGTPQSLFDFLSTDLFTLLLANLTKAEATLHSAQSRLANWKNIIHQTYNIKSAPGDEVSFRSVFGSKSSLILVRPDGYVAFAGTENSLEALVKYLNTWFPYHEEQASA